MTSRPEWYREDHQYLVHGGPVGSRTDGQVHHVSELQVARLYGLMTALSNVLLFRSLPDAMSYAEGAADRSTVHIVGPQSDGDYRVPDSVELWRRQQLAGSAAPAAPPLLRGRGDVTVRIHDNSVHDSTFDAHTYAMRYAVNQLVVQVAEGTQRAAQSMREFASALGNLPGESAIATAAEHARAILREAQSMPPIQPEQIGQGLAERFTERARDRIVYTHAIGQSSERNVATEQDSLQAIADLVANMHTPARGAIAMAEAQAWVKADTVPKEGSRAWNRVVKKGCVGERGFSGDFACNDYAWGCDSCPVVVERMRHEEEFEDSVRGNRMHRFWRAKRKAKAKNEIDFKSPTILGIDPASPDGDRTVVFVGGRRTGLNTIAKRYRKG